MTAPRRTKRGTPLVLSCLLVVACGGGSGGDSDSGVGGEGPIQTGAETGATTGGGGSPTTGVSTTSTGPAIVCTKDEECIPGNVCDDGTCKPDPVVTACADTSLTLFPLVKPAGSEGDSEFNGHGPHVTLTFELSRTDTQVKIKACVTMAETQSDWTKGELCKELPIDVKNTELVSSNSYSYEYIDADHEADDVFEENSGQTPNEVIKGALCIGDRAGDDICSDTGCSRCTVEIGCVRVKQ